MASVGAFSQDVLTLSEKAGADLSAAQYKCVKYSSGNMALCSSQGEVVHGILLNDDASASGEMCTVAYFGVVQALLGGTVSQGDPLCVNASGVLIKSNDADEYVVGYAQSDGSSGSRIPVRLMLGASFSANSELQTFTSSANYSSSGQYTAMKVHTTAGQIVQQTTAGSAILGILQNAPASSAEAEVAVFGPCTAKAGTGGVSAGAELAVEVSTGKLIAAVAGDMVVGWALAAISADANGSVFLGRPYLKSVDGVALTATYLWVGNGSGKAAAVALSGGATMSNAGVVTLVVAGQALADGKIWAGNGSGAAAAVTPSGDLTMANTGAFTIANDAVTEAKVADSDGTGGANGLSIVKQAQFVWDFAVDGGGAPGAITPADNTTIPDNAVVQLDSIDVLTTCTSGGGDAGTMKIGLATDGDLSTAIAISDASNVWDAGAHAAAGYTPLIVKTTGARQFVVTTATQAFTAGKIAVNVRYWVSQ